MDDERKELLLKNSRDIVKCLNTLQIPKNQIIQALSIVLGNAFKISCDHLDPDVKRQGLDLIFKVIEDIVLDDEATK